MPRKRKRQKQPPGNRPATFSNRPLSGLRDLARAQQHPEEPARAQSRPQPRPAGPGSGLHQDDETTFRQAMVGVKPLQPRPAERPGRTPRPPRETAGAREEREVMLELERLVEKNGPVPAHLSGEAIEGTASGVDRFLLARLRRGDFSLQAHLDLHGLTREQARQEVERFLDSAILQGLRCVLIIHGRGRGSSDGVPVLKNALQAWLSRSALRKRILAFTSARPCDGGAGAVYVLLRKR